MSHQVHSIFNEIINQSEPFIMIITLFEMKKKVTSLRHFWREEKFQRFLAWLALKV